MHFIKLYCLTFLYIICTYNNQDPLNKKLTFSSEDNFFENLQRVCEENKIDMAVCTSNSRNISCNFYNVPLKDILEISLGNDYKVEKVGKFITIRDAVKISRTYIIYNKLNSTQMENLEKFLSNLSKQLDASYTLNKTDGTIIFTSYARDHEHLKNYVDYINDTYNQQVMFECKVISISNHQTSNKNLNALGFIQKLLNSSLHLNANFSFLDAQIIKPLLFNNDLDAIVKFLSFVYETHTIQDIRVLIAHNQEGKFTTEERRYIKNQYETTLVPNNKFINNLNFNTINNPSLNGAQQFATNSVIKNLKPFTAGIDLSLIPKIRNDDVIVDIKYEQSTFQDGDYQGSHKIPTTNKNSFSSCIKIPYGKVIVINGLKNKMNHNEKKNLNRFWLWNYIFGHEQKKEAECQIIFLIKVYKC